MEHETNELVNLLIKEGWLKTPEIIEAFRNIRREDFLALRSLGEGGLSEDTKNLSELNEALPIGFNQTISQPLTVAFMLELLQPQAGDKILDVGSGSGWTTALAAFIVRQKRGTRSGSGKVISIEIIPELAAFGAKNVDKYNFIKDKIVDYICADGSRGFKKEAPYDKILVSAAISVAGSIGVGPLRAWKEQLKPNGRLVCPIQNSIWLFIKTKNEFLEKEYPGFVFVPLV